MYPFIVTLVYKIVKQRIINHRKHWGRIFIQCFVLDEKLKTR